MCRKCAATKASGKFSCCARGGAWYKICGDADDGKFDHTWTEGIWACKGFTASALTTPTLHAMMLRRGPVIENTKSAAHSRNTTKRKIFMHRSFSVSNVNI